MIQESKTTYPGYLFLGNERVLAQIVCKIRQKLPNIDHAYHVQTLQK